MEFEFKPRLDGDFEYDVDEKGNKIVTKINNLNIISIDLIK